MKKLIIGLSLSSLVATAVIAPVQAKQFRNDPNRPVAAIAADLGIETEEFVSCFSNVRPASKGTKASGARERMNKAILLPCLQKANVNISNASLDAVMDKYRPEGRVAGRK